MREVVKVGGLGRACAVATGIAVGALASVGVATAGLAVDGEPHAQSHMTWEFALQADRGTLDPASHGDYVIRLGGVDRKVLGFQDRPGRRQETISLNRLSKRLALHRDTADPPNGVIAAHVRGRGQRMMGVELQRLAYKPRRGLLELIVSPLREERRGVGILPRHFGPATVFVDGFGGHYCTAAVDNNSNETWTNVAESKWSTDDWFASPPGSIAAHASGSWESTGGFMRGCSNTVILQAPNGDEINVYTPSHWSDDTPPSCTVTGSTYACEDTPYSDPEGGGVSMVWAICYATDPNCET